MPHVMNMTTRIMNEQRLTLKTAVLAVLIILAGLPLRFELAAGLALQIDEAMRFVVASEPTIADAFDAWFVHTHPPLEFLLYHQWLGVGNSEFVMRLPSIIAGVIAAWVAYLWLSRLTDRRAALVGVFVLTFSLPLLRVSAQVRSYTFMLAFLMGALWFSERFRESQRVRHLVGETICLTFALLAHYATAWVIGLMGLVGLVRAFNLGLGSSVTRAWVASQFVLAGICVGMYLFHVRTLVGTDFHDGFWVSLNQGNVFVDSIPGRMKFAMLGGLRFIGSMSGTLWLPMLCVVGIGAWLFSKTGASRVIRGCAQTNDPQLALWCSQVESVLWGIGPFVIAALLQALRIYPLGATRHSLWLMPFVALAASAAARPLLARPQIAWKFGVATACLTWAWWVPYRQVTQTPTNLTPDLMHQTAAKLRSTINHDELILTDEAGRYLLAHYLGRDQLDRGRDIGHGFHEFRIDGFRVIEVPCIHLFGYSLRDNWSSFEKILGESSTQPLWLVCMCLEVPEHKLAALGSRLPPAKVESKHSVGDNHLLRVQFRPPENRPAEAQAAMKKPAPPAPPDGSRS